MKLSAYYSGCDNFGDKLTKELIKSEYIEEVYWDELEHANVCGIGSIINRFVKRKKSLFYNNVLYVFGSGMRETEENENDIFIRKLKIYAVRGEYTKGYIERVMGHKIENVVLGDGGLLVRNIMPTHFVEKKYELGIIPHYIDEEDERFHTWKSKIKDSVIISVKEEPETFIAKLMECKRVVSTAMHPLIACDALRIPNIWGYLPNANQRDMSYKFNDYYSAYGKEKEAVILDDESMEKIIEMIDETYDITDNEVFNIIDQLESSFNKMEEDIRKKYLAIIFWKGIIAIKKQYIRKRNHIINLFK